MGILSETDIKKAEAVLKNGDRVEIAVLRDCVKVWRIRREEARVGEKMQRGKMSHES